MKGIVNLGNTCFFNAVIQTLISLNWFQQKLMNEECKKDTLWSLFDELLNDEQLLLRPVKLYKWYCREYNVRLHSPEDAHECYVRILEALENYSLIKKNNNKEEHQHKDPRLIFWNSLPLSFLRPVIYGFMSIYTVFECCQYKKHRFEVFNAIHVPQFDTIPVMIRTLFTNDDDQHVTVDCDHCHNRFSKIRRQNVIHRFPNVLVFYSCNVKNEPYNVLLSFSLNRTKYRLKSIIVYEPGHYYAIINRNNRLYRMNDDQIELIDDTVTTISYVNILFYELEQIN